MTQFTSNRTSLPSTPAGNGPLELLDGLGPAAREALETWLDRYCALLPVDWARIWRMCSSPMDREWIDAEQRLHECITAHRLDMAAWLIRDYVQTICHTADVARGIRYVAESAALAVAFANLLDSADVGTLCAPFESGVRPKVV